MIEQQSQMRRLGCSEFFARTKSRHVRRIVGSVIWANASSNSAASWAASAADPVEHDVPGSRKSAGAIPRASDIRRRVACVRLSVIYLPWLSRALM